MREVERRRMRDLRAITAEVVAMMAEAGLMMREALAVVLPRHGYPEPDGGGSP